MATQYEIEHNIKDGPSSERRTRRVDMSSFYSFLRQISTGPGNGGASGPGSGAGSQSTTTAPPAPERPHNNPHATPTPVDAAALFRLLQDQFRTLMTDAPTAGEDAEDDEAHHRLLRTLLESLETDIANPPKEISGLRQEDLDSLDRVPKGRLRKEDNCPICAERFLDDPYPLVVRLPCHASHKFDLECVGPWLLSKGTCPMCRKDLRSKKRMMEVNVEDDAEEEDEAGMLYG